MERKYKIYERSLIRPAIPVPVILQMPLKNGSGSRREIISLRLNGEKRGMI